MKDQLRPGQRLINYASLVKGIPDGCKKCMVPDSFEIWLWTLSEHEFKKAMKWGLK